MTEHRVTIATGPKPRRQCGGCTLCCKLLPMADRDGRDGLTADLMIAHGMANRAAFAGMMDGFDKPAGVRCQHQRHHKGCAVYAKRPLCCRMWNCRWLVDDDTADIRRPDHAHYVIDIMPDMIRAQPHDGSPPIDVQAVQIWIDPRHRDAHRDPTLRAYLLRRGAENTVAMIRYSESDGFVLIPPNMADDGQWHEQTGELWKREAGDFFRPDKWEKATGDE